MTAMLRTLLNGKWWLIVPEHRAARREWTTPPYWEPERLDSMHANIRPGDAVYDIGSEEADFAGLMASWGARLVLIEPSAKTWPNARAIWEANGFPMPLGWYVGFASSVTDENPPNSDVNAEERDGWPECAYGELIAEHGFRHLAQQTSTTPQIRLDDLAMRIGIPPDVVTMDVEGAEWHVLAGMAGMLTYKRPTVYVSVHPGTLQEWYGQSEQDVLELMAGFDYAATFLAEDHERHWVFHHPDGRPLVA